MPLQHSGKLFAASAQRQTFKSEQAAQPSLLFVLDKIKCRLNKNRAAQQVVLPVWPAKKAKWQMKSNKDPHLYLIGLGAALLAAFPALASTTDEAVRLQQDQLQREQLRRQDLQQLIQPPADVRLDMPHENAVAPSVAGSNGSFAGASSCFPVRRIMLNGDAAGRFRFALDQALGHSGFKPGDCLDSQGINRMMALAQNAVIGRGYTTTRILAAPQDLNSGILELTVLPGRIRSLHIDRSHDDDTHAGRIAAFQNEFPAKDGDILNLRDLEQGLENLKRLPTVEADIRIRPSERPSESDVVVAWRQQTLPYRLTFSADNGGSRATGLYQGSMTFSADNPFGLSDMFYASASHDLGHKAARKGEVLRLHIRMVPAKPFTAASTAVGSYRTIIM